MTTTETQPIYITSAEAARAIGISHRTMRAWLESGRFKGHHLSTESQPQRRHWRILLYDVQSFNFELRRAVESAREEMKRQNPEYETPADTEYRVWIGGKEVKWREDTSG